jgi:cobalt-precorrin-5B (C1)-methyltransferase
VGVVTKKGLPVPPGEPAVNPVPRQMMRAAVAQAFTATGCPARGVVIELSIPGGEELAQKTYNPRLGIVGGLSILGTTGIVVPYSTDAWLASVVQSIDVAVAQGCQHLVFVVGAQGERTARQLFDLPDDAFIQLGPFFGAGLRHAAKSQATAVSIVAMIGKLAKFAAGNESVHSTVSRQDFAFLGTLARDAGADDELVAQVTTANTAQEAAQLMSARRLHRFFSLLAEHAYRFAGSLVASTYSLEVLLVGTEGEIMARYPDKRGASE